MDVCVCVCVRARAFACGTRVCLPASSVLLGHCRAAVGTPEHEELPDHGQAIANAAVKQAVEKGVTYFDCAPGYWDFRGMERLGPVRMHTSSRCCARAGSVASC